MMVRRTAKMVPPKQSTSPPHLKSDFQRDGAPASWKDGYPRQWGSEVYRLPFGSTRINSASLSSDERLLAVAVERDIHIFDTETFKVAEKLEGHTQEVGHVEFQRGPTPQAARATSTYLHPTRHRPITRHLIIIWHFDQDGQAHEKHPSVDVDAATRAAVDGAFESITSASRTIPGRDPNPPSLTSPPPSPPPWRTRRACTIPHIKPQSPTP